MVSKIFRYDVYWAQLDPTVGGEPQKTRPVVVVSPDSMNHWLNTIVVCPLTSTIQPDWFFRHTISLNGQSSDIAIDQIRTISKAHLVKRLGKISTADASSLRRIIEGLYATAEPHSG